MRNCRFGKVAGVAVAVLVAGCAIPALVQDDFWMHVIDMALINALIGLGLNVILRTGQISLGHAAFMAVGAYVSAQLSLRAGVPLLFCFLIAGVSAGVLGGLLGRLILRLKGVYFVLFTFALNEFGVLFAKNFKAITGGNNGITGIPSPTIPFLEKSLRDPGDYFYLALTTVVIAYFLIRLLYQSSFGRAMDAVRESEVLAASTGYDPMKIKTMAFALGCALAGLGGSLFAHFLLYISPFSFTFWQSVNFLLINIIGGTSSILGPLIGALVLTPLPELLRDYVIWQQVLYGLLLMLFMRFLPDGITTLPVKVGRLFRSTGERRVVLPPIASKEQP